MIKETLLPADQYVVINKTILNDHDWEILIMLYQPIIGIIATSLYFSLWNDLDKSKIISKNFEHHHLTITMGVKLSDISEAREKLEAMGLIKTYLKKDNVNNYLYLLYSPMTAYDFLNNPILSTTLYSNVGQTEYNNIVQYFKLPNIKLNGYEDISCHFNEIFESSKMYNINNLDIKKITRNNLEVIAKIDLDNILSMIPDDLLNIRFVTKDIKELIIRLSFIYDYNDDEMINLIKNSLNNKKGIDKELLRKNCRTYYQFDNAGKLPSLIYKTQPEYLRKPIGDMSPRAKTIYQFETTTPYDFLYGKYKDTRPSKGDVAILEYLMDIMNLKPGVVNVLIDYVLKINNNKLTKNFIEAIASQWKRSKIETVEDAMSFAEKEFKSRKNIEQKTKVVSSKPSWLDKNITRKEMSAKEKNELEEIFKNIR